ncbi:hypothetical protein GCM10011374_30250 [Kocuria dechangensis]|uniref:Uncharacterized protein n=2 Tax=Kocuria dechangensis TaxID=1176249 RepID=A0A917H1M7_9MICC|nr:hypothetical protein GCM10011374_30250 [Kocuria dechangensis]
MGTKRKRTPQQIAASRKKAAGMSSGGGTGEERFDFAAMEREYWANKGRVTADTTYRSGARTGRQVAPSKTDGKNYW